MTYWCESTSITKKSIVLVRPITRENAKRIKEALNGLIKEIWADYNMTHSNLSPNKGQGLINVIKAIDGTT